MAALTTEDMVADLAPILKTAAGMTEAAIEAALLPILLGWAAGGASLNRAAGLAQKGLQDGDTWRREYADWATGSATGGPNNDGLYPMTTPDGVVTMWPGLAKLTAQFQAEIAAAQAAADVVGAVKKTDDYNLDAIASGAFPDTVSQAMRNWLLWLRDKSLARPSLRRLAIYERMLATIIASGAWNELDLLHFTVGHARDPFLVNWRNPGFGDITPVNTTFFTADTDIRGNGVDSYLDTGLTCAALPNYLLDDCSLGVMVRTDASGTGRAIGAGGGGSQAAINAWTGAAIQVYPNTSTAETVSSISSSIGLTSFSRTGPTAGQVRRNGKDIGDGVFPASNILPTATLAYLRVNSLYDVSRIQGGYAGGAVTLEQDRSVYVAFSRAIRSLKRTANV